MFKIKLTMFGKYLNFLREDEFCYEFCILGEYIVIAKDGLKKDNKH